MYHMSPIEPLPRELITGRLRLRRWSENDRIPFAELNRDPKVMEFFPELLTSEESDAAFERINQHFSDYGFGMWAVEPRETSQFIGFIGLAHVRYETPFTPCVEIGWRLASEWWGKGFATEGAQAVMSFAENSLRIDEVVSQTSTVNLRSQRVMQKLDMVRDPAEDFDHPLVPSDHVVCRHVLFRRRFRAASSSSD